MAATTHNGSEVFAATLKNALRKYPDRTDARYRLEQLFPEVLPSFHISAETAVFTIGSCFARNVEEALLRAGVKVPTAAFIAPQEEAPGRPNRVLNQYNLGTMLQWVAATENGVPSGGYLDAGNDMVVDGLLSTGSRPVSRARADERRAQIVELYREGLRIADTVVITLGLIETWYDHSAGLYMNEAPTRAALKADEARYEFRRMDVDECLRLASELIERLSAGRPRNIVMTVSPVPLQVTFAGGDAVTANGYSKAVLRVVAELVSARFPNVDYFPSFEAVSTMGLRAFGEDNVHVKPMVVESVVQHMLDHYLEAT